MDLDYEKLTYNYRPSRARRISENGFGILSFCWRIFRGPIDASPNNVSKITKACIALHNNLADDVDRENNMGEILAGGWRENSSNLLPINRVSSNMASRQAVEIWDQFNKYFQTDHGKVPWQENVVRRGRKN